MKLSPELWKDGSHPTMDQYRSILRRGALLFSLDLDFALGRLIPPVGPEIANRPANLLYHTAMENYTRTDASGFKGPARNETLIDSIAKEKEYVDRLHAEGIPVLIYQNENNFDDTVFSSEEVSAMEAELTPFAWAFGSENRRFACVNKPGWGKYIVERLMIRVGRTGADGVFMDNNTPFIHCRCRYCFELYHNKYAADLYEDMGHPETVVADMRVFEYIGPRQVPKDLVRVENPNMMRYLEWRIERLVDFYKDIRMKVEEAINRKIIFTTNGHVGIAEQSAVMDNDVIDLVFSEDGFSSPPVSNGFSLKLGTALGDGRRCPFILTRTQESAPTADMVKILNAEGRALGGQAEYWDIYIRDDRRLQDAQKMMRVFFSEHFDLYTNEVDANDIAILYSYRSDLWTSQAISPAKMVAALLEDMNLTYDVLIAERDEHVKRLSKYPLIIIPGIEILSNHWFHAIQTYLDQGGNVISTGTQAVLDEHLNERKVRWSGKGWKHTNEQIEKEYFNNRKIISIHSGFSRPSNTLAMMIEQAVPEPSVRLEKGEPQLTINHTVVDDGEAIHFVNRMVNIFPVIPASPRKGVTLMIRPKKPVSRLIWYTPEQSEASLHMEKTGERIRITLPEFKIYGILRIYYDKLAVQN
jgi:hypothetical protein